MHRFISAYPTLTRLYHPSSYVCPFTVRWEHVELPASSRTATLLLHPHPRIAAARSSSPSPLRTHLAPTRADIRNIRNQWSKHAPPALPFTNNNNNNNSTNPYANNPPPPTGGGGQTNWNSNPYGSNPPPPAQTYQPSNAGYYGAGNREGQADKVNGGGAAAQNEHEHGYEWEQAREAERLERERENGPAPPGYDVAASRQWSNLARG